MRVQQRFHVRIEGLVPPTVFKPMPKVDSAVMVMEPRPPGELPPCHGRTLDLLLRAGFGQRRKQLAKLLAPVGVRWAEAVEALGFPPLARAEDLSVRDWIALARWRDGMGSAAPDCSGEWFDVVDEQDEVIGRMQRAEVHATGARHRAIHLFLSDKTGRVLLQKRSAFKDKFPNIWDSSAAGHVAAGDDYAVTAAREIGEELGISAPLVEIGRVPACEETGMEFVAIYHARHDGPFRPDPDEVAALRFFEPPVIDEWIRNRPQDLAPGLIRCWQEAGRRIPRD